MILIEESHYVLPSDCLSSAIAKIDKGGIGIILVIDSNRKLLGTITDGDVRRALIQGYGLDCDVTKVMNTKCISAKLGTDTIDLARMARKYEVCQIPILNENHIIQGIFLIKKNTGENFTQHFNNKVIIMAGGKGQRLMPLTQDIPKPMLNVGDRPILETIIERFSLQGFKNFIICVNYLSEKIIEHFESGKMLGVNIEYIMEKKILGTAGALSLLPSVPNDPFFVVNGDLLTSLNFNNILEFHKQEEAILTMGVKQYTVDIPYGVIKTEENRVVGIEEKPSHSYFVNAGIYVVNPSFLDIIPKDAYCDMPLLISESIKAGSKISCFPLWEQWLDIGRHDDYKKANFNYHQIFS